MIYYIGIIIKNKTGDYKLMFLYKKIKQERKDCMNFEYAKITRSRLMGSMGLVIKHSDNESEIFEYYLLDCEGLGFCDYVRLENPTKEEAYMEEERLMGGLGENRVFISEDRALFLVQYFGQKNIEYDKPLPDGQEYYMQENNKRY